MTAKLFQILTRISFFFKQGSFILVVICGFTFNGYSQTGLPDNLTDQSQVQQYGFIENKGQLRDQHNHSNKAVKFLLAAKGMNILLKANSFSYDTYVSETVVSHSQEIEKLIPGPSRISDSVIIKTHRVDINLLGANNTPEIIADERSTDYITYYTDDTNDPVIVHHYRKLTYKNIYPNIDLVFDTRDIKGHPHFEYYFIIRSGGDAKKIKLQYAGASTEINNGALKLKLRQGNIFEKVPFSFLVPDSRNINFQNVSHNENLKVGYKKLAENVYGFQIPHYDQSKNLLIDPVPDLVWGTYYGETDNDWGFTIARDNAGNIIMGGGCQRSNTLATAGSFQAVFAGEEDGFIAKFQPNGVRIWASYYGGSRNDNIFSVTTDANDNIIFCGSSFSANAIATPGTYLSVKPTAAMLADCFIAKFNTAGLRIWGTYFGGEDAEQIHSIKTDNNGNIFIAGWSQSTTGIGTPGSFQPNYAGGILGDAGDAFLAKFDANGNRLWGTYYGGPSFDRFYDMDLDNAGNIYAAGIAYSNSGILSTPGSFQPAHAGGISDGLLVKFDNNGNRIWSTYFGGSEPELIQAINVDYQNNIIIGGMTQSTSGIATAGSHQPAFGGDSYDCFLAKFNPQGVRIWSTYYGGNGQEDLNGITSDLNNNIYVTGWTFSTTGISTAGVYQTTGGGLNGVWTTFIGKFNNNGVRQWGTYYGANGPFGQGIGEELVTDNNGNIFITGWTSFTNRISTCGAVQPNWGGNFDGFLAEFSESITNAPSVSISANPVGTFCAGTQITFTALPVNGGINPVYQWKLNGQNVGANSPTFIPNSLVNGDIVECMVSVPTSACATAIIVNSNKIIATITSPVTPVITVTASAISICTGNTVNFTAVAQNGGNSPIYQWKVNGVNAGNNATVFSTSNLRQGDIVSCELTSSNTCVTSTVASSNSIQMSVTTIPNPTITLTASPNPLCAGETATLNCATLNLPPSFSYQWKLNGTNVGANNAEYTSNNFKNGDIINCILSGTIAGCSNPFSFASGNDIVITVNPVPNVNISASDTIIFVGDSVILTSNVTGSISGFTWSPVTSLNNPGILNPVATPVVPTEYKFLATDANGCVTEKSVFIDVFNELFIPNAFTPNKDGKNELFKVPDGISMLNTFSIYNRWGIEIFHTADIHKGWDGTFQGVDCPVGVYIYIIRGKSSRGPVFLKGIVTIAR